MTPESAVNPGFTVKAPGRKRPDEGLGSAKTEAPMVGDGGNEGRPESRSRRIASVYGDIAGAS